MIAMVTGAGGLIGTEAVEQYTAAGYQVVAIENDMRAKLFGPEASTGHNLARLIEEIDGLVIHPDDIRDRGAMESLVANYQPDVLIHTAAQPSHDKSAMDPVTDFDINAVGTLNLLEAVRTHSPKTTFVHCSSSKVYGSALNDLPYVEYDGRYDLEPSHTYYQGFDTTLSIDRSLHSPYGVSKAASDLLVQEYGLYYGINTVCFRPNCMTGGYHAGTKLHGFLSYLMRCAMTGEAYTVNGYKAKVVRDNIHSSDLVSAFRAFTDNPRPGAVYNLGGGRLVNCSMIEAIYACEKIVGEKMNWILGLTPRVGDHIWWISDNRQFEADYPEWKLQWTSVESLLRDIFETNQNRWHS